jgi:hypothetical protein
MFWGNKPRNVSVQFTLQSSLSAVKTNRFRACFRNWLMLVDISSFAGLNVLQIEVSVRCCVMTDGMESYLRRGRRSHTRTLGKY